MEFSVRFTKVARKDLQSIHVCIAGNDSCENADYVVRGRGCFDFCVDNDFVKINLTVVGFIPKADVDACKNFEGMKARVGYVESSDKSVAGQVVAIELRK